MHGSARTAVARGQSAGGVLATDGFRSVSMHDEVHDEKEEAKRWNEEQQQEPPPWFDAEPGPHPTAGHVPCIQRDRACLNQEDRHADPVDAETQVDLHTRRLHSGGTAGGVELH